MSLLQIADTVIIIILGLLIGYILSHLVREVKLEGLSVLKNKKLFFIEFILFVLLICCLWVMLPEFLDFL